MKHPYGTLLSPILRRGFVIRNRMSMSRAYPPFSTGVESRELQHRVLPYIESLVRNGAALVVLPSPRYENPDSKPMQIPFPPPPPQREAAIPENPYEPDNGPPAPGSMAGPDISIANVKLTYIHAMQAIHDRGSLALISLMEMEPSGWAIDEIPEEALSRLTDAFARRCRQFQLLGADGCSFYMCYRSSLMAKVLSPDLNRREDQYGAPWALALEAFQKVRKACGEKFLIEIEVSGEDVSGGFTLEDMAAYLSHWERYIDIVQLRAPTVELSHAVGINSDLDAPIALSYAKALKQKNINLIFAPVGGFQDPVRNEAFLSRGYADMICMARAFLCDSDYYEKILQGRGHDVIPCIRCNKCHTKPAEPNPGCSVNPRLSFSMIATPRDPQTRTSKKLAVIGGGPAGMQSALIASQLGHHVTLYESRSHLGGQLCAAGTPDFKWPVKRFREHLIFQVEQSPITVKLSTEATAALLVGENFDAIFYAAGAVPNPPAIPGIESAIPAISVYENTEMLGRQIVIVGGSETGLETAMYLVNTGREVTLLTRQSTVAPDSHDVHYREIVEEYWQKMKHLHIITGAVTHSVTGDTVTYIKGGDTVMLSCSNVIAVGMIPCQERITELALLVPEFRIIGDAKSVGDIRTAMRDGYTAAYYL